MTFELSLQPQTSGGLFFPMVTKLFYNEAFTAPLFSGEFPHQNIKKMGQGETFLTHVGLHPCVNALIYIPYYTVESQISLTLSLGWVGKMEFI